MFQILKIIDKGVIDIETGTSIPKRENELRATWHGAMKQYFLTASELEEVRRRTEHLSPTNADGQQMKQPISQLKRKSPYKKLDSTPQKQSRAKERYAHLAENEPPKLEFLKRIATGRTIVSVAKEWGLHENRMYYWVKKWQWVGIKPGTARELLAQMDGA